MADLHLTFGEPKHGWLPVQIDLGNERCEFAASNVLNDPVHELALAALHVLRYSELAVVSWWLESEWSSLVLEPRLAGESVLVSFREHHTDGRTESARRTLQAVAPTRSVCREIGRALRELLSRIGRDFYESSGAWNRSFPEEIVAEIYSELRVGNLSD